jgi:hypothetical protein
LKKIQDIKNYDSKWIKETLECILYIDVNKLSDKQIKMLRELYLENIKDGLKPKEALEKAYKVISCFKI